MNDYSYIRFPFGKHAGKTLDAIPTNYLAWAASEVDLEGWLMRAVEHELERRTDGGGQRTYHRKSYANAPSHQRQLPQGVDFEIALQMLEAGRRSLARKNHPDVGGDGAVMVAINCTSDHLRDVIAEVFGESAR